MEKHIMTEDKAKMLDKMPIMVYRYICNLPGHPFVFVSDGCKELTGYTPEEFGEGKLKFIDLIYEKDPLAFEKIHTETIAMGVPLESTLTILTKSGAQKQVLMRSRVLSTDPEGMPHIVEGFIADITKQLRIEVSTNENRSKSDFFSKMGYGVRTPLNAILGLAELGLREDMPPNVREYTQTIKEAGEKLMMVFNDIWDYTKIISGDLMIEREQYSLASMISDVVTTFTPQCREAGLDFLVFVDSKIPVDLLGDVVRLRQVIAGLLANSIKFTTKGYISLSIEAEWDFSNLNLIITVEDTGRGIKEEDIKHLFKEFAQFDEKTIEGTGIGLVITKALVSLMGGRIDVSSTFGIGSIFTVTIPQKARNGSAPICLISDAGNKNVLIFEDRKNLRNSTMRTLKNLGIKHQTLSGIEDLPNAIIGGGFTHALVGEASYAELRKSLNHADTNTKIIRLTDPFLCLSASNLLCDAFAGSQVMPVNNKSRFTAPTARVLVVDDISANLLVAQGFLAPYNIQVDTRESGAQAIEAVKSNNYDLILMDYLMPVMSGAEATLAIRDLDISCLTDCKNVPIVALTANVEFASRDMLRHNGFDDFLAKPIEASKLNAIMERWIPAEKQEDTKSTAQELTSHNLHIEGVNVSKGVLKSGGSFENYLRVLARYKENGSRLIEEINDCIRNGDTHLFKVHVHALGGISESIGADDVADAAKALESAALAEDRDFIEAGTPPFLARLEALLDNIYAALPALEATPQTPVAASIARPQALLIDDTDTYLLILNDILKDKFDITLALDGETGLKMAQLNPPDIIFLDIVMPGISGYEVLQRLKSDDKLAHIPVILMSANNKDEHVERGYALGAASYVAKPIEKDVVEHTVNQVLQI
ncbi:MAG: response regulator [Defluviitaleaceae bacterium]|nr:response regulator [Defluviitaleaceae bacterium]